MKRSARLILLCLCLCLVAWLSACTTAKVPGMVPHTWTQEEAQLLSDLGLTGRVGRFLVTPPEAAGGLRINHYVLTEAGTWQQTEHSGVLFDEVPEERTITLTAQQDGSVQLTYWGAVYHVEAVEEPEELGGSMRLIADESKEAALGDEIPIYVYLGTPEQAMRPLSVDVFHTPEALRDYTVGRAVTVTFSEENNVD